MTDEVIAAGVLLQLKEYIEPSWDMTAAEPDTDELILSHQVRTIHKLYTHCTHAMS